MQVSLEDRVGQSQQQQDDEGWRSMERCSGEQGVFVPLSYRGSTKNNVIQMKLPCYLHCLVFQRICCGALGYHQYPRCLQHLPSCRGLSLLCTTCFYLCLSRRRMPMPAIQPPPLSHYRRRRPDPGPPLNVTCRMCGLVAERASSVCTSMHMSRLVRRRCSERRVETHSEGFM